MFIGTDGEKQLALKVNIARFKMKVIWIDAHVFILLIHKNRYAMVLKVDADSVNLVEHRAEHKLSCK